MTNFSASKPENAGRRVEWELIAVDSFSAIISLVIIYQYESVRLTMTQTYSRKRNEFVSFELRLQITNYVITFYTREIQSAT